ncbi:hypothetical protein BDK51DRAFT_31843 [Blyttiomyces helicus]|uniref:Uncharacterized protein n=1 Tax=Blyttiomyces helicus TaxID=388810 RepID=A0A4P9W1E1_9FUNG|nr:hypothetical protein BDK51DRAFT_31843 [Blyttiomyces helicus]|eukprot:RKO84538.1 hypothetical protein BDK51DRAFT_31843 [Blyttiomyces helicus]
MQLRFLHDVLASLPPSHSGSASKAHVSVGRGSPAAASSQSEACPAEIPPPSPAPRSFSALFRHFFPTPTPFVELLGMRQMNGFGLWDGANECIGGALYPSASYFNHSCRPNLARITGLRCADDTAAPSEPESAPALPLDSTPPSSSRIPSLADIHKVWSLEPRVTFRAVQPIAAGAGLHHSYIDLTLSRDTRREMLKEGYCFDCACERCCGSPEQEEEYLRTYPCRKCGAVSVPGEPCARCGA